MSPKSNNSVHKIGKLDRSDEFSPPSLRRAQGERRKMIFKVNDKGAFSPEIHNPGYIVCKGAKERNIQCTKMGNSEAGRSRLPFRREAVSPPVRFFVVSDSSNEYPVLPQYWQEVLQPGGKDTAAVHRSMVSARFSEGKTKTWYNHKVIHPV